MDVKIESMIFGWDERIPDTLIKFINSVTLTKGEQELRGLMEVIRWDFATFAVRSHWIEFIIAEWLFM